MGFTAVTSILFGLLAPASTVGAEGLTPGYHAWRGDIVIRRQVVIGKGSTLYIGPGTRITVEMEAVPEGIDAPKPLLVTGRLVVDGREKRPVVVTGKSGWGEIFLDDAVAVIRHVNIENATWGFHIHGGFVLIEGCELSRSVGGMRTYRGGIYVNRCFFHDTNVAIRYWEGGPVVRGSRITGNRVGIFFREGRSSAIFRDNYLDNSEYNLKMGDFSTGFPDVRGNFWGTADMGEIEAKIFDGRDRAFSRDDILPIHVTPPPGFNAPR